MTRRIGVQTWNMERRRGEARSSWDDQGSSARTRGTETGGRPLRLVNVALLCPLTETSFFCRLRTDLGTLGNADQCHVTNGSH